MLMYGNTQMADLVSMRANTKIYNLTSLSERYATCRIPLVPPNSLGANTELEFDYRYRDWIMNINNNFSTFMVPILDMYNGCDVYFIISEDEWSIMLVESLMKLIQQQYGINAVQINCSEDLLYAKDSGFNEGYGLYNLDRDKDRYIYLYEQYKVMTGGVRSDEFDEY